MIIIDYDFKIADEEKTNDCVKEDLEAISSYVNRIMEQYKISFPDFRKTSPMEELKISYPNFRKTSLTERRKIYPPTFKK